MVRRNDRGHEQGLAPVAFLSLAVGVSALGATAWGGLQTAGERLAADRGEIDFSVLKTAEVDRERAAAPGADRRAINTSKNAVSAVPEPTVHDRPNERNHPGSSRIVISPRTSSAAAADPSQRPDPPFDASGEAAFGRIDPARTTAQAALRRTARPGLDDRDAHQPRRIAAASFLPRLKPRKRPDGIDIVHSVDPAASYLAPAEPVAFAPADDFTGGRESLFAEYAQARARSLKEQAYLTVVLNRGETLSDTLTTLGASAAETAAMIDAAGNVADPADLRAGTAIEYAFEPVPIDAEATTDDDPAAEAEAAAAGLAIPAIDDGDRYGMALTRLRFRPDDRHIVTAWRTPDGRYDSTIEELDVEKRYAAVAGVIHHSLFMAGHRAEVPPEIMQRFANLFLYDIDFARDIRAGDRFEVVYEVFHDEEGRYVGSGDIVFAGMSWHGNRDAKGYYRFDAAGDVSLPYFDIDGESAARLLMKTPIEGARVTSHFGKRKHPVLGYTKQHKGVDFGAPSGTPIMAAGDGKIVRANRFGSFGNYIKIQHANGFETAYAHLKGFAKGMTAGKRVKQGDIIGYVGTTGRSTGPHLHYEVSKNGAVQNPMTLDVANGRVLDGDDYASFDTIRMFLDTVRVHPLTVAVATTE